MLIPSDEAYPVVNLLGQLSCTQFIDLNPSILPYEHRYVKELVQIEETERMIG